MKARQEYPSKIKIWQVSKDIIQICKTKLMNDKIDKFEEVFDLELQINKLKELLLQTEITPERRLKINKKLKHNQKLFENLKQKN